MNPEPHDYSREKPDEKNVIRNSYAGAKHITPDIIDALRRGEADAYKAVYLSFYAPLEKFLTALLCSREDAQEITQDILAYVWEKRETLDPGKNFSAYIYTMARHAAFDFFRKRKVRNEYAVAIPQSDSFDISGEDILLANESEILAQLIINRMPEKRRRIYELHRNQGLTYDEIATKLKISPKTVEYHMSQALKDLRQVLTLFIALVMISQ